MKIETERLLLRYLRLDDLEDFFAFRSDPEVCRYQGYDPITREQAVEYVEFLQGKEFGEAGEWAQIGVEEKLTGRLIGDVGLKPETDVRLVEFGVSFSREFQGKGFAGEALTAVLGYLFKDRGVHRVTGVVDVENAACIKLMERCGFRREAHYLKSFNDHGEWRDEYLYALLESEHPNG